MNCVGDDNHPEESRMVVISLKLTQSELICRHPTRYPWFDMKAASLVQVTVNCAIDGVDTGTLFVRFRVVMID